MNKLKGQELAVKENTDLQLKTQSMGFENFHIEELIIPRIRLLQPLSKAVTDEKGSMGQFQDTLTGEIIGDKLDLVLLSLKNGAVYFEKGKGLICRSDDGIKSINGDICTSCPYDEYWGKFKSAGEPPKCSGMKEFLVIRRDNILTQPYPMLLSFIKTSHNIGKQLASMAYLYNPKIFARSYIVSTEKTKNDKGVFAKFVVRPSSDLNEEEKKAAIHYYELLNKSKIKSDEIVDEI